MSILCFEWRIGKSGNVRIFKHYKILTMLSKKERNLYDLKEMENIKNAEKSVCAINQRV